MLQFSPRWKRPLRPLIVSLFCVAPLMSLAGCSNNPYPPGEAAKPILFRAMGDDPRTLDPSVSYMAGDALIVDAIYPSYFHYHFLKQEPFTLQLMLGAKEPERKPYQFTENGKTATGEEWIFKLRDDLRFQDDPCFPDGKGRKIVAADIIYAFRRMADPKVECPVLSFFEDKIIGFGEYIAANRKLSEQKKDANYKAPIEGLYLDPQDPLVFHIRLKQPYPQLKYLMAMHFTTPIAHEAAEKYGEELARHPVGCGPYVMSEFTSKKRIVLTKNPNYYKDLYPSDGAKGDAEAGWLKDAGQQLPLNDKVVFSAMRESTTAWNMFLQGYLDGYGVTQENFSQVVSKAGTITPEMKAKGITMRKVVTPGVSYLVFNMEDPLIGGYTPQKRKLRQAISLAVDAQAFIDLFSQGQGRTAESIIPPGLFGYDAKFKNPYRRYEPQLKRAKQLLKEAGYPDGRDPKTGEKLVIYYDTRSVTAAGRQYSGLLVKQLTKLGVQVQTRAWRPNVWEERVNQGKFQLIDYGWLADYPDPENFVFLLYGPNKRPGPNHSNYNNPEYNRLFERMRAMENTPERLKIIEQMRSIATEDCPLVFTEHGEDLALTYDWIHNSKPHPIANDIFKYRRVDAEIRARSQSEWNHPIIWPLLAFCAFIIAGSLPAANTVKQRRGRRLRRTDGSGEIGDDNLNREMAAVEYSTMSSSGSAPMRVEPPLESHPITRAPEDES